jgi:hypothetical protein
VLVDRPRAGLRCLAHAWTRVAVVTPPGPGLAYIQGPRWETRVATYARWCSRSRDCRQCSMPGSRSSSSRAFVGPSRHVSPQVAGRGRAPVDFMETQWQQVDGSGGE